MSTGQCMGKIQMRKSVLWRPDMCASAEKQSGKCFGPYLAASKFMIPTRPPFSYECTPYTHTLFPKGEQGYIQILRVSRACMQSSRLSLRGISVCPSGTADASHVLPLTDIKSPLLLLEMQA